MAPTNASKNVPPTQIQLADFIQSIREFLWPSHRPYSNNPFLLEIPNKKANFPLRSRRRRSGFQRTAEGVR
ncbi:uncharacterized protein PHALS_11471 [Plasmopara halstedii]|uniref:Uncharacterized protein n=1 Tax=Plasmopara halstedii TaxID=4781 RepID=A0A0P1A521_PLAHL|nr:uncharacterized protein PHALS_11471 [Plasmopara halstedii]CEG35600.1 hypothetical protein PHALS_11471 [Plasmopara halstedii]|eukprot:XP_024571969.1 hypothetical protein PHALS_11471 [Plasmopara halstedii]